MRDAARSPFAAAAPLSHAADELLAHAAVAAAGSISLTLAEAEALRGSPGPGAQPQVAKSLRNSDEQTIAGVAAMLRAIESRGWQDQSFLDWGVVGCPRFLGRMIITGLLHRYFEDSKYSINPHVIPNFSLHSTSGTVSVGFTMRGPNFGVGGGPGNVPEGLLTALSLIAEGRHPGIWLLLSEFDPEPRPDKVGKATNAVNAHAAALAITQQSPPADAGGSPFGRLRLLRRSTATTETPPVRDLVRFLGGDDRAHFRCPVEGLGIIEFEKERTR
jgi:hypothetical protein